MGFFIETTNKNWGYNAKKNYGIQNRFKKFLKFSNQPRYLLFSSDQNFLIYENLKTYLPENLLKFLTETCELSYSFASLFGICLDLGYTAEQIIDTFKFSPDIFNLDKFEDENIANLMKKRSIAVYFSKNVQNGFSPIFSELSTPVFRPNSSGDFKLRLYFI